MTDHVAMLRTRIEKAEGKVLRYKKSLESAESELRDLHTALRVIESIAGESSSASSSGPTTMARQIEIVESLGVGRENAKPPADLYTFYTLTSTEDITIDTFRTTLWRMKGKTFEFGSEMWNVEGDSGVYWKESHTSTLSALFKSDEKEDISPWDDDLEVPF